jgi:hypothetical protein
MPDPQQRAWLDALQAEARRDGLQIRDSWTMRDRDGFRQVSAELLGPDGNAWHQSPDHSFSLNVSLVEAWLEKIETARTRVAKESADD